ncbi:MAG: hypothetical protein JJD97_01970 [Gemmatimonadaceae bacterium]|nr:hypothetical protein [Gemmatimonadaceae bacterium]
MRNPSHSPGGTGELFPDATLPLADGRSLSIDSLRVRYDLVILMLGAGAIDPAAARLLDALARGRSAIEGEDGRVLVVHAADRSPVSSEWRWPFPLLLDAHARLHTRVGALDAEGQPTTSLYVTDRYREIYAATRPEQPDWPATVDDVLQWLTFVNIQCPECNPPEW